MEPTKQSALSHRGKSGHHRNAQLFGVIGVDPVLKLQNFGVTVKQVRRENGISYTWQLASNAAIIYPDSRFFRPNESKRIRKH
jgi:hypothetical protein